MKTASSRKPKWPREITLGNVSVKIYKRTTPNGKTGFMLAYRQDGKRKFDSYSDEATAIQEANTKARQLSTLGVKAAQLTDDDLRACVAAMDAAKPLNLSLVHAVGKLVEAAEIVGDVAKVTEACRFYSARNKRTTPKPVAEVVAELLLIKKSRGAAPRYLEDLKSRLKRFAKAFPKDACNVTTADIQAWLDSEKLKAQNFMGFRRTIHLFFKFCAARGYAVDNPAASLEKVKVKHGATQIFTPKEITKLLASAKPDFLPCIAIGAFAGLRSAEIERLEWSAIDLESKHIIVGEAAAKTASRRVVPIHDNLAAWLAQCAGKQGNVWKAGHEEFYEAQQETATAAGVKWKHNALRHSYASYRFAQIGDAGRVAGECGNSASVIHKHYRELVKPADAVEWFGVLPEGKLAPVKTAKILIVNRRQRTENVARLPQAGTAAAN
jgi:integrase